MATFKELKANPTPMAFSEVFTAAQQGVIDGAENNELALTSNKHGEVAKYYTYNMHQMVPDILIANDAFLNGLSQEELDIFQEGFRLVNQVQREAWVEAVENARDRARNQQGVQFLYPDQEPFVEACRPLHKSILQNNPGLKDIYNAIQTYNAIYPAQRDSD